ncbi:ABC transporter ATP-binding protein [Oceanobacillus oncorhynchi subsp. incaldanensis]|uniref:ABC transporter ATP-binding protein n=1 Tax=Oceanobacillus oncorhynchi TaxID=545501 RepID=UPI001B18D8A2|nr:ABC transporter ATP-binding protein [Oceanobacillus oncorhynchi]GIO20615.1 ABC transporter ATP-binding protein [Oceanobacillus oncorhynchi subsp. incaldanensis]
MLTIQNVTKHYEKAEALKDISMAVPEGTCYGLVGPNGAGKSTLIKMITSIIRDYEGKIEFNEQRISDKTKQKLGYVPQDIVLEENITASGNLYLFGRIYGLKGNKLAQRTKEVLALIGLSERSKDKVATFSGGMKRRLNIGCALMHNPDLIIMDEPTVGIDPQSRQYIFQMIEELKTAGKTVIYASHYMEEVERLCDDVAFLDRGELIENGLVSELLQQYAIPSIYIKADHISAEQLESYGDVSQEKDAFLIYTEEALSAMENLISYCREKKIDVERLELVRPRLEDVFFRLTGSNLRD